MYNLHDFSKISAKLSFFVSNTCFYLIFFQPLAVVFTLWTERTVMSVQTVSLRFLSIFKGSNRWYYFSNSWSLNCNSMDRLLSLLIVLLAISLVSSLSAMHDHSSMTCTHCSSISFCICSGEQMPLLLMSLSIFHSPYCLTQGAFWQAPHVLPIFLKILIIFQSLFYFYMYFLWRTE